MKKRASRAFPFVRTDGGRAAAGFADTRTRLVAGGSGVTLGTTRHKRADCVARAIALTSGVPYGQVWTDLLEFIQLGPDAKEYRTNATPDGGILTNSLALAEWMLERGFTLQRVPVTTTPYGHRVRDRVLLRRGEPFLIGLTGPAVVIVRGHATALIDGEIHDSWDCAASARREVRFAFMYTGRAA